MRFTGFSKRSETEKIAEWANHPRTKGGHNEKTATSWGGGCCRDHGIKRSHGTQRPSYIGRRAKRDLQRTQLFPSAHTLYGTAPRRDPARAYLPAGAEVSPASSSRPVQRIQALSTTASSLSASLPTLCASRPSWR